MIAACHPSGSPFAFSISANVLENPWVCDDLLPPPLETPLEVLAVKAAFLLDAAGLRLQSSAGSDMFVIVVSFHKF